ncbi:uncharacterized protein LOC114912310 [Scleropages formosus]|uniref:uncharacterized protein LOC114912310 n=1 Tax=Scleropages formosus TaxID=113540 RepID=UPI0010FA92D1|nr:uncharacterized protein LOC114912310 [Scleropages formosus]
MQIAEIQMGVSTSSDEILQVGWSFAQKGITFQQLVGGVGVARKGTCDPWQGVKQDAALHLISDTGGRSELSEDVAMSGKVMAVVRSSLQKAVLFLQRLQKVAVASPRYQKLRKDMQGEADPNGDIFRSVDGSRPKGVSEDAVFLKQQRQSSGGLTQNSSELKAACDSIRLCPEASAERWSRLLALLEELWRWLGLKDEELTQRTQVGGDALSLLLQHSHCTGTCFKCIFQTPQLYSTKS